MIMGRKKDTLQQRNDKKTKRRRYRYDENTPFIELFKPEYQRLLIFGAIAKELKSLLRNGDSADVRELTFFDFRLTADQQDGIVPCTYAQIHRWLAKLLLAVGKDGTRYGESMIFRYLTDGHSTIFEKELSLKASVSKALRKFRLTNI